MRGLLVAGILLGAWLTPAAARACSYSECYYGNARWQGVSLHTQSPAPLDGVFMVRANRFDSRVCLDELAPHLAIAVRRGGKGVPGQIEQLEGLPDLFVWRPDAPLTAGATYEVAVSLDNAALGPPGEDGFGEPCGPSELAATFEVTIAEASGEVPAPPGPTISTNTRTQDQDFRGVACCPGVTPQYGDPGSCEGQVHWFYDAPENACAYLYDYTTLVLKGAPHAVDASLASQLVYQLVVEDVVVDRELAAEGLWAQRSLPACARVEAVHVGTGTIVASTEECPSEEVAATIGGKPLATSLGCEDALLCGDAFDWTATCQPFDATMPPPAVPPSETQLDATCPAASVPADTSDAPGGCTLTGSGPGIVLLALGLRRRRDS